MNEHMRTKRMLKSVSAAYLVAATVILIFLILFAGKATVGDSDVNDLVIYISFLIIGGVSFFFLTASVLQHGISLFIIHWFFVLMFFCIVPLKQYLTKLYLYPVDYFSVFVGNVYILAWCVVYGFFWQYSAHKGELPKFLSSFLTVKQKLLIFIKTKLYLLTLMCAVVTFYFVSLAGPEPFLLRAAYGHFIEQLGGWHPFGLLITYYVKPLLFCALIVFWWVVYKGLLRPTLTTYLLICLLLGINLLINNPLNSARFYAFMTLFGILVLFSSRRQKPSRSLFYVGVLFFGLFVAKTIDQITRYLVLWRLSHSWSLFNVGDFDAHENFIHTIQYVNESGITYGKQLLGALLFWLPRTFWLHKPFGSGHLLATEYLSKFGAENSNISSPLIAEMYLNFHIFGILIGAAIFGVITGWLDRRWFSCFALGKYDPADIGVNVKVDFFYLLYPFLLGLYLFQLRGAFMSSFAYTCGFVLAFVTVIKIMKLNLKL